MTTGRINQITVRYDVVQRRGKNAGGLLPSRPVRVRRSDRSIGDSRLRLCRLRGVVATGQFSNPSTRKLRLGRELQSHGEWNQPSETRQRLQFTIPTLETT